MVTKCIVDGKTGYTDEQACAGQRFQLPIDPESNLIAADRGVQDRLARSRARSVQPVDVAPAALSGVAASQPGGTACAGLQSQIQAIDAAARQPQSASMQDRLRTERASARNRQVALGC